MVVDQHFVGQYHLRSSIQFPLAMPAVQFEAPEDPPEKLFEEEGRPMRHLQWDENNHFAVITTVYGSVIPKALPFCLVNGLLTALIYELKQRKVVDLTTSPSGHKYLVIIMSFLMVSRVKMIYDRYMKSAASLTNAYKACREIVQYSCAFSAADKSEQAKQWRHDVAYSVIIMLRVTMSVLEFQSDPSQMPWSLADIDQEHREDIHNSTFVSFVDRKNSSEAPRPPTRSPRNFLAHTSAEERTLLEEACRAPIVLAFNVRQTIMKQRDGTWLERSKVFYHPCNEETRLLDYVGDFLQNFHSLQQLLATPLPFPMVNMAKIFLFLWIYTVPCVLCHFTYRDGVVVPVMIVFLVTFGFLGLEIVSIELSDPFGDDVSMIRFHYVLSVTNV